jgi:uncharacterized protein YjiK
VKKRCHTSLVDGVIGLWEDVVTVYGKEYIMSTESLSSTADNQSAVIHSYLLQIKRQLAMNVLLNISAITMHSSKMDFSGRDNPGKVMDLHTTGRKMK